VTAGTETRSAAQDGPGEALRVIGAKLKAAGFDVRTHYRYAILTEICATNPASPDGGSVSINHDGFMTWEHTASIEDGKNVGQIADVITVLLSAGSRGSQRW
jgi:hypothetical protein